MKSSKATSRITFFALSLLCAQAPAATVVWLGSGGNDFWSNAANWMGGVGPRDGDDAVFGASPSFQAIVDGTVSLASFTYATNATPIDLHVGGGAPLTLTLAGAGIVNDTPFVPGQNPQNFYADASSGPVGATLLFRNTASVSGTAATTLTANGAAVGGGGGGSIVFADHSSTDIGRNANRVVAAGATVVGAGSGSVTFRDDALAQDSSQLVARGGVGVGALGGQITAQDRARLENVVMVLAGENGGFGARLDFHDSAFFSGLLQTFGAGSSLTGGEAVTRFFDNATFAGSAQTYSGGGAGFAGGRIEFHGHAVFDGGLNSATITNQGSSVAGAAGGQTFFYDDSSAAQAGIFNDTAGLTSTPGTMGGVTEFHDRSHAGQISIVNGGADSSIAGTLAGRTFFLDNASAESATITNSPGETPGAPGGVTVFAHNATAGNATIAAYGNGGFALGGQILFQDSASGGTARIITSAGGLFDISALTTTGMAVGSLEGDGSFRLGSKMLAVGGNNLSTEVTGVLSDGGQAGGAGGSLTKVGTGTLTLSAANTYTGATTVNAGTLYVNGTIQGSGVTVGSGGMLGGTGTINAPMVVSGGGTLSPGGAAAPGVLTVNGCLTLAAGSIFNYRLGAAGVVGGPLNDLLTVSGNLTLAGTLNVTDSGGFGLGVYRLINYGGALTDNGLSLGTFPAGAPASYFSIQTGGGQVNLVLGGTQVQFWDGAHTFANGVVNGGTGNWDHATTNWTHYGGTANSEWNGRYAVFGGTAGTVTVTEPVTSTGMQFYTNGYTVNASGTGSIALAGATTIRTDPGTATTINAPLTGSGSLTKQDTGMLTLGGNSSYTGGTTIAEGFVVVTNAAGSGLGTGPVLQLATSSSELQFVNSASAGSVSITNVGAPSTAVSAFVRFLDNATAGSSTITNQGNTASGGVGGQVNFESAASAGHAVIINAGSAYAPPVGALANNGAGITLFLNNSTAGSATFSNTAGLAANTQGGRVLFADSATAGAGTITNQGGAVANGNGGLTEFRVNATAGTATLLNQAATVSLGNGGTVNFRDNSSAGSAFFTQAGSAVANAATSLGAGTLTFYNASSAANGTFFNQGASASNTFGGGTFFRDTSTAGAASITNQNGVASRGAGGGFVVFANDASAGSATITSQGGSVTALDGGYTNFTGSASAGSALLTAAGATAAGAGGGRVSFLSNSTAGWATIHDGGGTVAGAGSGQTIFYGNSTAGEATLYADAGAGTAAGGGIVFREGSSGGTARAIIAGTGSMSAGLDISQITNPSMTLGSIEGTGIVSLGSRNLIVGGNNVSTTFSGLIRDGGFVNAAGGALSKTGAGLLTLTGANTYTGGTVITGGALIVTNAAGLALGTGVVTNDGTTLAVGESFAHPYGSLRFTGNASAGSVAISNVGTPNFVQESATTFNGSSTAATAKITNQSNSVFGGSGGETFFYDHSTAGSATITNAANAATFFDGNGTSAATSIIINRGGGQAGQQGGFTLFNGNPGFTTTAANSTIFAEGGAVTGSGGGSILFQAATAGNATLYVETGLGSGATLNFINESSGGTARVIVQGGVGMSPGEMSIQSVSTPSMTIGSIEGGGVVTLGSHQLVVGANGASTVFSGLIRDVRTGPATGGSLAVVGPGAVLNLTGSNTYTGGTTIGDGVNAHSGKLVAANTAGSATGFGPVVVDRGGTLGGNGSIFGPVTLNAGGLIAPGDPSTLTFEGNLTWNGGGVIQLVLGADPADSDFVSILGHLIRGTDGEFRFNLIDAGVVAGQRYQLISAGGVDGFSASDFTVSGVGGGFELVDGALDFSPVAAAVPEPATVWLMLGGLLLFTGASRRRPSRAVRVGGASVVARRWQLSARHAVMFHDQ